MDRTTIREERSLTVPGVEPVAGVRAARRLAWSVWAVTLALLAAALALGAVNGSVSLGHLALAVAFLCFPTVGALIVSRRPGNAVGWICCAIGPGVALAVAPLEYVIYALAHLARCRLPPGLDGLPPGPGMRPLG
jgi:hypothetical protein